MKKLLTLLLILPLLIACSKDDDSNGLLNGMTPWQQDRLIVGQWIADYSGKDMLTKFNADNTFEEYDIIDKEKKIMRKSKRELRTGTYKSLNYGFEYDGTTYILIFTNKNRFSFQGFDYDRTVDTYTVVE